MKKLILSLCALFIFIGFIQAQTLNVSSNESVTPSATYPFTKFIDNATYKVVCYTIPVTLAKATNNYSNPFTIPSGYFGDSTKFISASWQSNDTVVATISLQVKNAELTGSSVTAGTWNTAATLVTNQTNAGNDTLYNKYILTRGTVPSGNTDEVACTKFGDIGRVLVTFTTPTTVGNSGYLRLWVYLKK
jgi:hypothetical protein